LVGEKYIDPIPFYNLQTRRTPKSINFNKNGIIFTFEGGFAVDADFTDGFSGSIEDPKIDKIR
jgi:hypothetical protein